MSETPSIKGLLTLGESDLTLMISETPMVRRDRYLKLLHEFKGEPLVKIITGMRRCGKSTLMKMLMADLLEGGVDKNNILYMNFEDPKNAHIGDGATLLNEVMAKVELKKGIYLFFDEIQDLIGWEKAINSMRYSGADIYVTGSNAKLLVSDFSTYLSGRYIEIEVYPLSFREYFDFVGGDKREVDRLLSDYMRYGGLPYAVLERKNKKNIDLVISAVFDTVFIKDIVKRNEIRDVTAIENVIKFVMKNIGNLTSIKSVSDYITSKGGKVTPPTIDNYLQYAESAYLIYRASKYDLKKKEYLRTLNKFYISDLGVRNIAVGVDDNDISGLLENIVYMELLFRGKKVAVGKVDENEVDFIVMGTETREYYQVTTSLFDTSVKDREFGSLKKIKDNYPKTVITLQPYPSRSIDGIRVVSLADFLFEEFE
jgi:predicted AAA+ superfamily ATPase